MFFLGRFAFRYLSALLVFRSATSMLVLLLTAEVLSWVFCPILENVAFKYLLVQGVLIRLIVVTLLFAKRVMYVLLAFKLGIAPLHLWYLQVSKYLANYALWFFISIHKILPLMLLIKTANFSGALFFFALASGVLIGCFSIFRILLLSSSLHVVWRWILVCYSLSSALSYWVIYTLCSAFIFTLETSWSLSWRTHLFRISFLLISGLPPFILFFFKFSVILRLASKRLLFSFILLLLRLVSIILYFRLVVNSENRSSIRLIAGMGLFVILLQRF